MHTKKTNNTNKLIQISYHSTLTKIQKLQNLKKKKTHFSVLVDMPDTGRNWPVRLVFKPVWNIDVSIPVYILVRYIPAGTAGTGTVLTTLKNTSTKEPLLYLTTSLNFLSLLPMGQSFRLKIINIFYYWHFGFSLVKASLSFFFYCTPWILDWTLHKQVLITNPRGDLGHCQKMSQISCILFFPILNFDYLIRKVRRIHDKLWFI